MSEASNVIQEPMITVDYRADDHGRLSKVFHLFGRDGKEIILPQKDAVKVAKSILKISQSANGERVCG